MPAQLTTWVPDPRPMRTVTALHGDVPVYAPISDLDVACGRELRELRMGLGIYLVQAAQRCGLSTVEYAECERGVRRFNRFAAAVLLNAGKATP